MLNFSSLNLVEPGAQDEFTVFSAGGRFKQPVFYERFDMTLEPVRRQLRRFDDALKAQALGKKQGPQDHQAWNGNSFVDLLLILKNEFEKLNITATYNLVYNAAIMVDAGMGYAVTLDKLVNTTGNSNLCFKPLSPKLESGLDIVWKKYQVFSPAAKLFLDRLKEKFDNNKNN